MKLLCIFPLSLLFNFLVYCVLGHYPVGYQIHSNNDLEEWGQLLVKGATRFKVDVHYQEKGINCAEKGYDSECFLLSHDSPSSELVSYNSSDELILFLRNDCQSLRQSNDEIVISLCFKSAPDKCDELSEAFATWVDMVDELYDSLTAAPPVGIQFVLDGDAKPEGCLASRWELWDSVWIQGSSPEEAMYSNEGVFSRFQVLNDREGLMDWVHLAREDYGKFTDSAAPYHLWEPDAQADFHEYIRIYESGAEHGPGFCFAINVDIAMFNVYTTPVTRLPLSPGADQQDISSVNVRLVDDEAASRPRIVSLLQDASTLLETFLFMYQGDVGEVKYSTLIVELSSSEQDKSAAWVGLERGDISTVLLPNSTWLLSDGDSFIAGVSVSMNTSTTVLLVTASSGKYCVYSTVVSSSRTVLQLESCSIFPVTATDAGDISVYDSVFFPCEEGVADALCALVLTGQKEELVLSTYEVSGGSLRTVAAFDRPVLQNNGDDEGTGTTSSARLGVGMSNLFIFWSADNRIAATTLPLLSGRIKADTLVAPRWSSIGVGSNLDVSVGSGGIVMLVTDFGFCYNSHKHNIRSTEKICTSFPKPSEHVLDYSIGLETDWADHLELAHELLSGESIAEALITPCHKRLLHGSYDQGSRPSVALSSLPSSSVPPFFVELHEGLPREVHPNGGCGNPWHRDGLILDSFPIDTWMNNLMLRGEEGVV